MVLAFAGDSTITRCLGIREVTEETEDRFLMVDSSAKASGAMESCQKKKNLDVKIFARAGAQFGSAEWQNSGPIRD